MSLKWNWTARQWELVLVYSHNCRQNKRAIWMRSDKKCVKRWERAAASAEIITRPSGMAFYCFGGGYW